MKRHQDFIETEDLSYKKMKKTTIMDEIINNPDIMHIRLKNQKNRNFDIEFQKYFIKNYLR